MMQVDSNLRPNCRDLLEMEVLQKNASKLGINLQSDLKDTNKASSRFGDPEEDLQLFKEGLLKTIIVPNNLAMLKLPKSNYDGQPQP